MFIIQCPILWYAKVCALPSAHSSSRCARHRHASQQRERGSGVCSRHGFVRRCETPECFQLWVISLEACITCNLITSRLYPMSPALHILWGENKHFESWKSRFASFPCFLARRNRDAEAAGWPVQMCRALQWQASDVWKCELWPHRQAGPDSDSHCEAEGARAAEKGAHWGRN